MDGDGNPTHVWGSGHWLGRQEWILSGPGNVLCLDLGAQVTSFQDVALKLCAFFTLCVYALFEKV